MFQRNIFSIIRFKTVIWENKLRTAKRIIIKMVISLWNVTRILKYRIMDTYDIIIISQIKIYMGSNGIVSMIIRSTYI